VQLEKDGDMVIRVWRAQSQPQNVEKYARHLRESVRSASSRDLRPTQRWSSRRRRRCWESFDAIVQHFQVVLATDSP
jgi:hypothetical protein